MHFDETPEGKFSMPETSTPIDDGTRRPIPQPGNRGFMFVNTKADVSPYASMRREIRSFVAKKADQRRKKEAIDRLKSYQPFSARTPQREEKEIENVHPKKTQIPHPPYDNSMLPVRASAVISQNHADPFHAYPVPMSNAMHVYFRHYRLYVIPKSYPFNVDRMNTWWTDRSLVSPALLHTKLCIGAGHKAALESRNGVSSVASQKSLRDCIKSRTNAIRALNDLLQDPVTAVAESTVLTVGSIVTIETINAEFAALQTHMKGLATLIELAGGLDAFEYMTLSSVYHAVSGYAALHNKPPIIPMSAKFRSEVLHEPAIFHPRPDDDYAIGFVIPPYVATLGSRFTTSSPWYTEVSPALKDFLTIFTRLIQHFELGKAYPEIVGPTDNDLFPIFQHDFLSAIPANNSTSHKMNDYINPPLRYSIIVYLWACVSHLQSLPIVRHMVETFKHILAPRVPYLLVAAPDLLLWMLVLGVLASKGNKNTYSWFILHSAHVARHLGLSDRNQARRLLGEFFYTDQPGDLGEELWIEVVVASSARICNSDGSGFDVQYSKGHEVTEPF
ncbi:hypothetical protein PMG11_10218 [Penicillium brasilianum]|uniref:Tachykinin family protein n=1 Tax=Penicillium brasilianum TaxID=104259 RepID=A0A0F7U224_PENBI|nr:hypothetical protein PMG11_10218 [Penicillium brasilianum]